MSAWQEIKELDIRSIAYPSEVRSVEKRDGYVAKLASKLTQLDTRSGKVFRVDIKAIYPSGTPIPEAHIHTSHFRAESWPEAHKVCRELVEFCKRRVSKILSDIFNGKNLR